MSDWRSRAQPIGQPNDPMAASRNAILQRNAEGIQNPNQTLPMEPLAVQGGSDWRSRAQPVNKAQSAAPPASWRSRAQAPARPPTIQQRIAQDIQPKFQAVKERNEADMQESADAYVQGEQSAASTGLQHAGSNFAKAYETVGASLLSLPGAQPVADAMGKVVSAGAGLVGKIPDPMYKATRGEDFNIGQVLQTEGARLKEEHPVAARNAKAVGQIAGLGATAQGADIGAQLMMKGVRGSMEPPKPKFTGTSSEDFAQMAGEAYDEAAWLGAEFAPEQIGNRFETMVKRLSPELPVSGQFTDEQKILATNLNEFKGYGGKKMTLDDVQRLDEMLTRKINSKFYDKATGTIDANGLVLKDLQTQLRQMVDEIDTAGNDALINGRAFWRAKNMMRDIEAGVERANMNTSNKGKALQAEAKKLYFQAQKERWPEEVTDALRKAAEPNAGDWFIDWVGSRLPAAIGLGTGNLPAAMGAQAIGAVARGGKELALGKRVGKAEQAVVDTTLKKVRPVNIPEPRPDAPLQLAAPNKMGPLPMTDEQIAAARASSEAQQRATDQRYYGETRTLDNTPKGKLGPVTQAIEAPPARVTLSEGPLPEDTPFDPAQLRTTDTSPQQGSFKVTQGGRNEKGTGVVKRGAQSLGEQLRKYGKDESGAVDMERFHGLASQLMGKKTGPPYGPFRDVSGKEFNSSREATRKLNRLMDNKDFIEAEIPISRLVATQSEVNDDFREVLEKFKNDGFDTPAVVKYNGQYYVTDGHHRIMARSDKGEKVVKVRLFDLDGDTQTDFPLLDSNLEEGSKK